MVTPFMGVWIEMMTDEPLEVCQKSHPLWVCGLESQSLHRIFLQYLSHPLWVCGLKFCEALRSLSHHRHTLYGCVD